MKNTSVTDAIYDAGFNSSGRFYEKSKKLLGMTPTQYRAGGANEEIIFALGQTTLGAILVASSKKGVVAILLGDDPDKLLRELQDRFPKAKLIGADKEYQKLVARVVGFIEVPNQGLNLPLDIRGTAFQQRVWRALQQIPAGTTVSYAEIECGPSLKPARQTISRLPFPAIASFAQMVPCRVTRGGSIANAI